MIRRESLVVRGSVCAALAALVVGCSSLAGASPLPDPSSTPAPTEASLSPVPTLAPTPAPTPSGIATDVPRTAEPDGTAPPLPSSPEEACDLAENHSSAGHPSEARDRSDTFWLSFTGPGLYDEEYESLQQMYEAVHLVVRGRIVDVYIGQQVEDEGHAIDVAFVSVAIDEILKGDPIARTDGQIEVRLWAATSRWDEIQQNVPTSDEYLMFLYNDAQHRSETGMPTEDPDLERTTYFRPNDQAVLRELDNVVSTFKFYGASCVYGLERFPLGLEGTPFEDVVERVRGFTR